MVTDDPNQGTQGVETVQYDTDRRQIRCPRCYTVRPLSRLPEPGERVTCGCGHSQRVPFTYDLRNGETQCDPGS